MVDLAVDGSKLDRLPLIMVLAVDGSCMHWIVYACWCIEKCTAQYIFGDFQQEDFEIIKQTSSCDFRTC